MSNSKPSIASLFVRRRRSRALLAPPPAMTEEPSAALSIRDEEFRSWTEKAEPGTRVEYHRGHLATDRVRGMSAFGEKARRELDALADRAERLADEGRLILTQERHGDADYSYIAIRAQKLLWRRS